MILLKMCNFRRLFYILYKIVWGVLRLSIIRTTNKIIQNNSFRNFIKITDLTQSSQITFLSISQFKHSQIMEFTKQRFPHFH